MFTYHDKWNSQDKIVNNCLPFMVARRVEFERDCLRTEFVILITNASCVVGLPIKSWANWLNGLKYKCILPKAIY